MELERKAYGKLIEWKETSRGSTALLINGARRVGKSHLAEEFGKREYTSYIVLDFAQDSKSLKPLFTDDMDDLDLFFNKLSALKRTNLYERGSLIILDEVQCFPLARQRIKTLVADGRYDYIETGSLLSIKTNVKDILIPSEEVQFTLNPLDFEEFLWAMGDKVSAAYLETCFRNRTKVGDQIHKNMMNRFREYMLVGGMPGVVSKYAETKDFATADLIKRAVLDLYRNDIRKFAAGHENKVVSLFDRIPSQLSKKEKKFTLSSLDKNARSRTYEDAFMWLADGMIINQCFNATDPSVGLSMNLDLTTQKCYMSDT
ncbi:MAG: AAA family ATPase, partial [Methanomassiliicoccaceae archaeon]|nr:AAA family ATPase [Methanomassiliicoccaceae archaeon]